MDLPFSHIDIYHGFKFCLDSLGNDNDFDHEETDSVKAKPSMGGKPGRFDTVVIMHTSDCETTGLKGEFLIYILCHNLTLPTGTRIGCLKVMFKLPSQVYGCVTPAWTKDPLAYVEWYAPLKPAAEDYH